MQAIFSSRNAKWKAEEDESKWKSSRVLWGKSPIRIIRIMMRCEVCGCCGSCWMLGIWKLMGALCVFFYVQNKAGVYETVVCCLSTGWVHLFSFILISAVGHCHYLLVNLTEIFCVSTYWPLWFVHHSLITHSSQLSAFRSSQFSCWKWQ